MKTSVAPTRSDAFQHPLLFRSSLNETALEAEKDGK